jgi:hypothetical protein
MPETKPHIPDKSKSDEAWTDEEKARGAPKPAPPTAAGKPNTPGRPTDDRAETESAAAKTDPKAKPRP